MMSSREGVENGARDPVTGEGRVRAPAADPNQPIPWPSEPSARLAMLEEAERAYLLAAGWTPVSGRGLMWSRVRAPSSCPTCGRPHA